MPIVDTPIVCGDWNVRDMKKMVADLVQGDDKKINDNLEDQFKKMIEVDGTNQEDYELYEEVREDEEEVIVNLGGDDFNLDNYEFYEEVSDESDANGETSKDEEVSEGSDESFYLVKYPDTQVPKQACG